MKKVIKKLNHIQQNLKAPKNQRNSFGNYNYRSAEDILEAVKPLLGEEWVVLLTDEVFERNGRWYVKATVKLTNGEESLESSAEARESETKKGMDSAQITGAASSYARKYAMNGLFAIDDTKDADTNEHKAQVNSQTKKVASKKPTTLVKVCPIHKVKVPEKVSKSGKHYFGHRDENGEMCFVN